VTIAANVPSDTSYDAKRLEAHNFQHKHSTTNKCDHMLYSKWAENQNSFLGPSTKRVPHIPEIAKAPDSPGQANPPRTNQVRGDCKEKL